MKTLILVPLLACLQLSSAFMTLQELADNNFLRCYDTNKQDNRYQKNINGQFLPLPNSIETFISLVERYESLNPNEKPKDLVGKFLKSFRIDDLRSNMEDLRDSDAHKFNGIKRAIFSIPDPIRYEFNDDDFTEDERCALHFMLSHTINDTRVEDADEVIVMNDGTSRLKHPRELGVVSLQSERVHAFALGRVLLGIYAALMLPEKMDLDSILLKMKVKDNSKKENTKINLVYAVTIGDVVTRRIDDIRILPNGEWTDIACPAEYRLEDNNGGFISSSEIRGAVDGLIIGRKIQEGASEFSTFRLSQILRQYYGFSGLIDNRRTRWCSRRSSFQDIPDFDNEMANFYILYRSSLGTNILTRETILQKLVDPIFNIRNTIEDEQCSPELSPDRKFGSPRNIFAILDYSSSASMRLNFQAEIIGNLSSDFDSRPRGNLMGVFSNLKPLQQNTLDVIVKNSGTAGCPSCFAKYYSRTPNKEDEAELFRDLNDTLTTFDLEQEQLEEKYQSESKAGSPGKIVLYFNFGNPSADDRVSGALWQIKKYFRGVTILAIGDNRDGLRHYVQNDQTDIFSYSPKTINDLKERINKVPAEYTYKACNQSTPSKEADNKQLAFIPLNKIQYWAMYPQYFLKSYWISMKFKPQDGGNIRVCHSRWYGSIVEGKNENCKDSTGGDIEFTVSNPCYKRDVITCEPFYFSVEGKKQPTSYCKSLGCSTPYDIPFEFEHEGISCNIASYVSVSSLALLFAALMYYMGKQ